MKHNEWLGKLQCSAVETRWKGLAARCRQEAMCRPPIQSLLHPWQSDMMFSSSKQHGRERLFDAEKNRWAKSVFRWAPSARGIKGLRIFEMLRVSFVAWPSCHIDPIFACSSPRAAAKPVSKTVQSGFGLRPSEFYESSPDLLWNYPQVLSPCLSLDPSVQVFISYGWQILGRPKGQTLTLNFHSMRMFCMSSVRVSGSSIAWNTQISRQTWPISGLFCLVILSCRKPRDGEVARRKRLISRPTRLSAFFVENTPVLGRGQQRKDSGAAAAVSLKMATLSDWNTKGDSAGKRRPCGLAGPSMFNSIQ